MRAAMRAGVEWLDVERALPYGLQESLAAAKPHHRRAVELALCDLYGRRAEAIVRLPRGVERARARHAQRPHRALLDEFRGHGRERARGVVRFERHRSLGPQARDRLVLDRRARFRTRR